VQQAGLMTRSKRPLYIVLLALGLGAACSPARVAGKNAAEASLETVKEQQDAVETLAKAAGDKAVEGAAQQLTAPGTSQEIDQAVGAAVGRALDDVHRDLSGPDGRISRDLAGAAAAMSTAAVQEAGRKVEAMLPECPGMDRRSCLRHEVRSLGQEASSGLVDGLLSPRALAAFAALSAAVTLAFLVVRGLVALVVHLARAAWGAHLAESRPRPPRREVRA
jgi:hypothetical protein